MYDITCHSYNGIAKQYNNESGWIHFWTVFCIENKRLLQNDVQIKAQKVRCNIYTQS